MQAKSPLAEPAKLLPKLALDVQPADACMHSAAPASPPVSSSSSRGFASLLANLRPKEGPAAAASLPPAAPPADPSSPVPNAASGMPPMLLSRLQGAHFPDSFLFPLLSYILTCTIRNLDCYRRR